MAFIPEDEQNQQNEMDVLANGGGQLPQQGDQQDPTQISGATTAVGGAFAPTQDQQQSIQKKPKGSGLFTNVQRYVNANKPQAQRLAGAVGRGITGQAQAINKQLEGQRTRFNKLVQGQEQQVQSARDFTERATQQAGTGVLTDPEFSKFQNIASGATRFDQVAPPEFQKQQARTAALTRLLGSTKRPDARRQLLRQAFAQSSPYTRGQQSLDEAVLAANPQLAQTAVTEAQAPVDALQRQLQTARQAALEDLYGLRSATAGLTGHEGSAYQGVAGQEGRLTGLQGTLDQAIVQESERRKGRQSAIAEKLRTGQFLTDEDFADMGVAEQDRGALQAFGTTRSGDVGKFALQQFLQPFDPKTVTRKSVASPEQVAQYNALSKLVGGQAMGESPAGSPLQFNTQAAIQHALNKMNASGVGYGNQGFYGSEGDLTGFQSMFGKMNPLLAMKAFGALGQKGIDAVKGGAEKVFRILPHTLDAAQNIVGSGGEIFQSAGDLAKKLTPDNLDAKKVINAFLGGGSSGVQRVVTQARQAAQAAAARAASAARSVFSCFVKETPIRMEDGSEKNVDKLVIGDMTYLGGMVLGIGQVLSDEYMYEYKGTTVTGSHLVFENGIWLRTQDSKLAKQVELGEETIVYPIVTELNVIVSGDYISSDYKETDLYYPPEEVSGVLNDNNDRNGWLMEEELKIKERFYNDN